MHMFFLPIRQKIKNLLNYFNIKLVSLLALIFLVSLVAGKSILTQEKDIMALKSVNTKPLSKEIRHITNSSDITEQAKWYAQLINRIGPEQAQDELEKSGLPLDGKTHLLNHTVGDFLYQKYGEEGIVYCKDYFSSSCYHGIIIGSLSDGKLDNINRMLKACREKGEGYLNNCNHGIGHGFLPWVGYANLTKALDLCDQISTKSVKLDPMACYTGVFMENIWGVHEGAPSPDRWVKGDDMHYPCTDPRIADRYLGACWQQQHTIMYDVFKLSHMQIAEECLKIANNSFQENCFNGLFQSIHGFSRNSADVQFDECGKMPHKWSRSCIISQIFFGIGQGDDKAPFEICSRIANLDKKMCYKNLNYYISYFIPGDKRHSWCSKISIANRDEECRKQL
jgi:hypothetical protein